MYADALPLNSPVTLLVSTLLELCWLHSEARWDDGIYVTLDPKGPVPVQLRKGTYKN